MAAANIFGSFNGNRPWRSVPGEGQTGVWQHRQSRAAQRSSKWFQQGSEQSPVSYRARTFAGTCAFPRPLRKPWRPSVVSSRTLADLPRLGGGPIQLPSHNPMFCPVPPFADVEVGMAGRKDEKVRVVLQALTSAFLEGACTAPGRLPGPGQRRDLAESSPQT